MDACLRTHLDGCCSCTHGAMRAHNCRGAEACPPPRTRRPARTRGSQLCRTRAAHLSLAAAARLRLDHLRPRHPLSLSFALFAIILHPFLSPSLPSSSSLCPLCPLSMPRLRRLPQPRPAAWLRLGHLRHLRLHQAAVGDEHGPRHAADKVVKLPLDGGTRGRIVAWARRGKECARRASPGSQRQLMPDRRAGKGSAETRGREREADRGTAFCPTGRPTSACIALACKAGRAARAVHWRRMVVTTATKKDFGGGRGRARREKERERRGE